MTESDKKEVCKFGDKITVSGKDGIFVRYSANPEGCYVICEDYDNSVLVRIKQIKVNEKHDNEIHNSAIDQVEKICTEKIEKEEFEIPDIGDYGARLHCEGRLAGMQELKSEISKLRT